MKLFTDEELLDIEGNLEVILEDIAKRGVSDELTSGDLPWIRNALKLVEGERAALGKGESR